MLKGEQGLPEFGVCNLGHHVLPRFYDSSTNDINWNELKRACRVAVRFQDNIVDYTPYFLEENRKVQQDEKRVGIGSVGLGTLLIKLGLRYGSDEAEKFIDKLYRFIAVESYKASIDIAEEKGCFNQFEFDKYIYNYDKNCKTFAGEIYDLLEDEYKNKLKQTGIRNVTILTQAPVGSTGTYIDNIPLFRELFDGVTTGIEPYFSWEYWRAGRLGVTKQTVDLAKKYMDKHGLTDVSELPNYFVTAMDLEPIDHVKVQGAIQKWTDSSISKTANCPNDYTIEQTSDLYIQSYDLGLKGTTVYRDGSREAQVLATKEEDAKLEFHIEAEKLEEIKQQEKKDSKQIQKDEIKKRPSRLFGFTEKVRVPIGDKIGKVYITVNVGENNKPIEVFVTANDNEISGLASVIGRLATQFLRYGNTRDNVEQTIKHLRKGEGMTSLPSVIARLIEGVAYGKIKFPNAPKEEAKPIFQECPNCGEQAYDKGNCICFACGVSKCN